MSGRRRTSWAPLAAAVVVIVVALGIGASGDRGPSTLDERVEAVAAGVRCPTCQGLSVAESDAASSDAVRKVIEDRLRAGRTPEQVRAELVERYGSDILLTPPSNGVGALVWVLPVVAVATGGTGLALAFARWRRAAGDVAPPSDDDRRLVDEALRR